MQALATQLAELAQAIAAGAMRCPYCGALARLLSSSRGIHSRDFGPVWVCSNHPRCNALVGADPKTKQPKGSLAKPPLRRLRRDAYEVFDALWQAKQQRDQIGKRAAIRAGYGWLAGQLGIPVEHCHIGWFDEEACRRVLDLCTPYARRLGRAA